MSNQHNLPESAQTTDPEFKELVDYFVGELPNRIGDLEQAAEAGDMIALRTLTHQLKGSAPNFGFPEVGRLAAGIEAQIGRNESELAEIETVRAEVGELIALCRSYFRND